MIWLEIIFNKETRKIHRWILSKDGKTPLLVLTKEEDRKFIQVTKKPMNLISEIGKELSENNLVSQKVSLENRIKELEEKIEDFKAVLREKKPIPSR